MTLSNRFAAFLAVGLMSIFAGAAAAAEAGAPSTIPHPVEPYLPITIEKNACLMCHKQAVDQSAKKGEIPLSHYAGGKLEGTRYECTLCHAPVTTHAEPEAVDPNTPTS